MSSDRQMTIRQDVRLQGKGLHTGLPVHVTLKPAPAGTGICFRRTDQPSSPWIRAGVDTILSEKRSGMPRCTTIGNNGTMIHTVEHLMSALYGLGIDNIFIELDNSELPGLDGSGIEFLKALKTAGVSELDSPREYIDIKEPIGVNSHGASIFVVPAPTLKISYTLDYHHPMLKSQFFSMDINGDTFEREIAPCRTFCLEEEARELQKNGLGLGANYENTLVVGAQGVIQNKVRFPNEFARHKVLDFIGDLYLLGRPIRAEVFAVKSGHFLNLELLKRIERQARNYAGKAELPLCDIDTSRPLDIQAVRRILPHRYPFLLVDRILQIEKGKRAVGIKNVTINDNFFEGHFPSRPVMPGVLILEALAQTGGVVVLTNEEHHGKVALFMAADKVKFRRLVQPGDQLVLDVEVLKDKSRFALLRGQAKVAGEVVAEAEMIFSYTDASFLD